MMRQSLQQVWPEDGRGGLASLPSGVTSLDARPAASYGGRAAGAIVWRQRVPRASFQARLAGWRMRLAGWRARNWRRAVLAWFVMSLIILAMAAEPKTDFPKAQARSVPAVRMVLRVAGGLTAAGVPVLLIALP